MAGQVKKVGVVICNYNKEDAVLECIQCILDSKFTDFALYVVDNASSDQSVEKIRRAYGDKLELIVNEENLGGSGGFNKGLRRAYANGHPYVMCVDNDAMLDENAIGELYAFLEGHGEAGMAGAKVYHMEMPAYVQQFGQKVDFENYCTEVYYYNAFEDGSMPEYLYVDSVAACSLMVRRSVIDEIGFMPEENFLYWDDTEWCYRCNLAGHKVVSVGSAKALHAMGAKREVVNTFPTYYAWRNWLVFFARYTPEQDLEKMAATFLAAAFSNVYEGLHSGESNRSKTIMLACDDAVHGIMGKAGENRIFELEFDLAHYQSTFGGIRRIYVEDNGFVVTKEHFQWILNEKLNLNIKWLEKEEQGAAVVALCESIFAIKEYDARKIYVDVSDCILADETDAKYVENYPIAKQSFVFAMLPVFLEGIKNIRRRNDGQSSRAEGIHGGNHG